jgi:hypothetical protein
MKTLHNTALQLSAHPETCPLYMLRLYPLSLERSALLAQCAGEERRGLACVDVAYEEEKMRVEEECRIGRSRVKERLLEGLEERRKKAREEKEGEGTSGGTCYPIHLLDNMLNDIHRCIAGLSIPPTHHPQTP